MKKSNLSKAELRRQAETKLGERKQKKATIPTTGADTLRLLHELEVHQVELEMQNEELVQSRAEAEEMYRQYTDLYDFAPVGYFTLAQNGTIRKVNLAGATLLGVERVKLINRRLGLFVSAKSRPAFNIFFEKLLSSEGKETCELAFEKNRGEMIWARLEATCFEGGQESRLVMMDITVRKLAEEALRAAGQQWQDTFDAIGDSISLIDVEWRVVKHNCAAQVLLGKSSAEVDGHTCYELMHGTSQPIENCPCQRMKKSKHRESLVLELNGRWFNVTVDPMFDSGGRLIGATHILSDITERAQAQNALKTSEANLKAIFENSLQSFMLIDKNLVIQSFNRIAGENAKIIFGEEIQPGDSIYKIVLPRERESFDLNFGRALAGETIRVEKMFEAEAGILWFEFHYAPVSTNNEISGVFFSALDITERKQMERELRESEQKFRSLVEQSTDGVILIDEQGMIIEWNTAESKITGIPRASALGAPFWDIQHQITMPERRTKMTPQYLKKTYFESYLGGKADYPEKPRDIEIVSSSGEHKFMQQTAFIIKTEKGRRMGVVIRDITERKQMEKALRESEARNRALVEAMPDLLFVQNRAGVYVDYHANKSQLLAAPPQVFLGQTTQDVLPPEQAQALQLKRDLAFETGEIQTHEYVLELADGQHYFEARMNAYDDDRILSIVRDITERKLAETELEYMKADLKAANIELQAALTRQQQLAHTDALTGINNRRYLYELAEHEFKIAMRYKQPLSVLMFDIDHFKQVNDTFGHAAGDQMLQRVTQVACAELRSADVIGRYGGEEFVVILPMTNTKQAHSLAERIRERVAAIRVQTKKRDAAVTLSIGIVEMNHKSHAKSVEDLIRRADETMYAAKQAGRNRTEIANP